MKVRDIMTWPVVTLSPTQTLESAQQRMSLERVRHLPVVDGDVLVGLISHRDLLAASLSILTGASEDADAGIKRATRVGDVMHGSVETASPDEDAAAAAERLLRTKIGCLPVVDERHHLEGMVTEADFVAVALSVLSGRELRPRAPTFDPMQRPPIEPPSEERAAESSVRAAGRPEPRGKAGGQR